VEYGRAHSARRNASVTVSLDREKFFAREKPAARFAPANDESRLQLPYGGPGEANVAVPPFILRPSGSIPLVVDSETAGISDFSVYNDNSDVRAMLCFLK
jgi:hypothetical protein